jgi:hypothetical protein
VDGPRRFDPKDWNPTVKHLRQLTRAALLLTSIAVCLLFAATVAGAEEPLAPTAPTGSVTQLGADPTVRVASHRRCVKRSVNLAPSYTGGGGLVATHLFINSHLVATRLSAGSIRISARRLNRGLNRYELISQFADGRAASVFGALRRCR